jgi:chemotaxis protein methyltransferase CheR
MVALSPVYEAIANLFAERTGFALSPSRVADVRAATDRAMAKAGVHDVDAFADVVRRDPLAFDALVVEVVVGETYFFRTPAQLDFVRREVLPALDAERAPGHTLRTWSAGCASGEEAYTLAILLDEEGWGDRAHVLGTDISRAALTRAREGAYGVWSMRGVDQTTIARNFRRNGDRFVVRDRVRRYVSFEYLNLVLGPYPSIATGTWGMDLVLCRNVAIYFTADVALRVTRQLVDSLAAGGWLILGPSDPMLPSDERDIESVVTPGGIFYRRRGGTRRSAPRLTPMPAPRALFQEALLPEVVPTPPPTPLDEAPRDPLAEARAAFAAGSYERAIVLTARLGDDADAGSLRVRAIANVWGPERAEEACQQALAAQGLSTELHVLHAAILTELGRDEDAARAARRAIYLDGSLAIAHFLLGSILRRRGDRAGARRAYRNARALCAALPGDAAVPLGDGQRARGLVDAANAQLDQLAAEGE